MESAPAIRRQHEITRFGLRGWGHRSPWFPRGLASHSIRDQPPSGLWGVRRRPHRLPTYPGETGRHGPHIPEAMRYLTCPQGGRVSLYGTISA